MEGGSTKGLRKSLESLPVLSKVSSSILESRIKGFKNKLARAQVHRPISEIQFNRELKKVLEKSTWFMPREREQEDATAPARGPGELHKGPGTFKKKSARRGAKPTNQPGKRNPYASVAPLFVPRTQDGTHVRRMREVEVGLSKFSRSMMPRFKLVDQGGLMLKHILTNSDPWNCLLYTSPSPRD